MSLSSVEAEWVFFHLLNFAFTALNSTCICNAPETHITIGGIKCGSMCRYLSSLSFRTGDNIFCATKHTPSVANAVK